jgi:predicted nucleotidyltransferase component of viral defense system
MSREGMDVDVLESTKTSGGYLAIIAVKNIGDFIKIQLEISFRQTLIKGEVFSIANDFVPSYPLQSLKTDQLVEGKLQALFDRHKARDFYDLYFLLRANLLTLEQKRNLTNIKKLLQQTNIGFNRELSLFLPRSQALIIRNFKKSLLQEIERNIS